MKKLLIGLLLYCCFKDYKKNKEAAEKAKKEANKKKAPDIEEYYPYGNDMSDIWSNYFEP